MTSNTETQQTGRGCIFYNFGRRYAARLLVALFTLRKFYNGPITVFLLDDEAGHELKPSIEQLDVNVILTEGLSKSFDRHRIFYSSPYQTTLSFDSDMIFTGPIDELWEPLERDGLLVTRFHAPAYGIDGTQAHPKFPNRVGHLQSVKELLKAEDYAMAHQRMVKEKIDVNIGTIGISRPLGDPFLVEWADHLERARGQEIELLDELLVVALIGKYKHFFADEKWNCPADEYFRQTNLTEAKIIHYFGDGAKIGKIRMGRNRNTWAGRKWFEAYGEAAQKINFRPWRAHDYAIASPLERLLAFSPRKKLKGLKKLMRRIPGAG